MQKKSLFWEIVVQVIIGLRNTYRWLRWKKQFCYFYLNQRTLRVFNKLAARNFCMSPNARQASITLMYQPGTCSVAEDRIVWEAAAGFAIWDEKLPLFAMAMEIRKGFLCIRQLQGVPDRPTPPDLRDWPKRFVQVAMRFARLTGLKGVRLYRAHTCRFYRWPYFADLPDMDEAGLTEYLKEYRQRMRRRYDGTARQMGFTMKKDYGEWLCLPRAPGPS
ncbi:MAG: hypothetical protein V4682_04120 [Patescibacteria group bacterium]